MEMNTIVTKYGVEPPELGPLNLNGIIYDKWLNVDTKEEKIWNGKRWVVVQKVGEDKVHANRGS